MATGGFKLSLANAKGKPGLKSGLKAPLEQPAKRRRLALGDDEPEDDNKKQEITGWDAAEGGAVDANAKKEAPKAAYVIPAQQNRSWLDILREAKRAAGGEAPAQNGEAQNGNDAEKMGEPKMAYGLVVIEKKEEQQPEKQEDEPEPMEVDDGLTEEQRLEAEALDALLTGKKTNKGAVIPMAEKEQEAYQNGVREAPEAPTLEAYNATPVEGFGAALLRGMGWKDEETEGKDPSAAPKRRPALLGIGAKPEAATGVDLGGWGDQKKGPQQRKTAVTITPVTLRNKRTGEMITEEQLKERMEAQKKADDKAARNSKFVGDEDENDQRREKRRDDRDRRDDYDSERRRDKDRRRDRDDDRDRRRDKDDDKDRRRDKDDDRDRRRDRDDDSSRRRDRDRKYRDDDYDSRDSRDRREKRRDRSRSPYDSDRRERRRDRDRRDRHRSRSRDDDDRRRRRRDDERDDRKRR